LFPELSVRETVELALEARHRTGLLATALYWPPSIRMERKRRADAAELIDFLGLGRYSDAYISDLSTGTRRIVELAGLLALDARVLCLDEPLPASPSETEAFGPVIKDIQRQLHASVIVIEHDMPLIMSISDRVYCLELGEVIAEGARRRPPRPARRRGVPRHRRTGHRPQRRGGPRRRPRLTTARARARRRVPTPRPWSRRGGCR
jgi:ABC-type branched-subunit amino acid transport system ATPase component